MRLLLLNIAAATPATDASNALSIVTHTLGSLTRGGVRELDGQPEQHAKASAKQFRSLDAMFGYGRRLFDQELHEPTLTGAGRPDHLTYLPTAPSAFPSLRWTAEQHGPTGEADVILQLRGDSEAAVNCAAVETWKLISDSGLPLEIVSSFAGFGRPDGRGWLEFHDGVSNMPSRQRIHAICAQPDPPWMDGGTYMVFLRLLVDLALWRRFGRSHQELAVGRDKLTGAALLRVDRDNDGNAVPISVAAPEDPHGTEMIDWRDPPQTTDRLVEASHIHRANQNRASPAASGGLRMFRQGYDFFDGFHAGTPRVGLNFISFQADLRTFHHVMHLPGWFGDANFGGPTDTAESGRPLIELAAGGLYAVPPKAGPFPGAALFVDT